MSASSPASTAGAKKQNPFNEILAVEQQQDARVARERESLDEVERRETAAAQERVQREDDDARVKAREELLRYKQTDVPAIIRAADEKAAAERSAIEKKAAGAMKPAVKSLVDTMLSPSFTSSL